MLVCLSVENATTRAATLPGCWPCMSSRRRGLTWHGSSARRPPTTASTSSPVQLVPGPEGVPLLDDCPTRFVGLIHARFGLGDHEGHLLTPIGGDAGPEVEVVRLRDAAGFHPGHPA